MTTNRKLTYFILMILVAAIFFYEYHKFQNNIAPLETETTSTETSKSKVGTTSKDTSSPSGSASGSPSGQLSMATAADDTSVKPVATWLADEAKNLENKTVDPQEKEAELRDKASRFTTEDISFLARTSTNAKATANERIEATYLLTLSSSTSALIGIAKTPLSLPSPQPVHSIGETLLMQEKAIRIMAIDELFNRVKDNAALRPTLLQAINQIKDEAVKHYALKRYQELK